MPCFMYDDTCYKRGHFRGHLTLKTGFFLPKYGFMKKPKKQVKTLGFKPFLAEFLAFFNRGPDGSRTHVRKRIPFPSTIIVHFKIPHS